MYCARFTAVVRKIVYAMALLPVISGTINSYVAGLFVLMGLSAVDRAALAQRCFTVRAKSLDR